MDVKPAEWRICMEEPGMKQVLIFCDHCGHRINFHDLFRRNGTAFYHALCWELSLLEGNEKESACTPEEHTHHAGPHPATSP